MPDLPIQQAFEVALEHHQAGRLAEAESVYRQVLAVEPNQPDTLHLMGVLAHQVGQYDAAIQLFGKALAVRPTWPDAFNNLGNALLAKGQTAEAILAYRQVIALKPDMAEVYYNLGIALQDKSQLDEVILAYRQAIRLNPDLAEAHSNLGNALKEKGQLDAAILAYQQAIALKPELAETHYNLGKALQEKGQFDEAIRAYHHAIDLKPNYAEAHNNLGNALLDNRQLEAAILAYHHAIALKPDYAEAHYNLGNALQDTGQLDQAILAYQQAITLKPDYAAAHYNLGKSLNGKGQLDQAILAYQQVIALKPELTEAHNNLGNVLKDKGRLDEAIAAYRRAIVLEPANSSFQSNCLFILHYHPELNAASIAEEYRRWQQLYAEPLSHSIQPHTNDRTLNRRLRIGYVSPDFRDHPVGRFLLPLLENHDRKQYEIFAYAQVAAPDSFSEQLRAHTDAWQSTVGLSDAQLAELIRADQIDILVDLAMHTANNRLLVFARKPAPIQVNYLAYVGSSGLPTMDYRLSDPYLDPPGMDESIYCEHTVRLPETYWCYQPIQIDLPPPATRLPQEPIRFGCLNNFCKINPPLVELWAKILLSVPSSQLLLHAYAGDHRLRMLEQFAQLGIDSSRIEFVWHRPLAEYFQTYQSLDITLDTTPYAGGTTTCDSLWMGVPVVTLAGERAVGRGGVSILSNVGLPELVARTPEEYIQIAVALAHDQPRLRKLRTTLRQRMEASPLMDAPKFARNIENAYRTMWHSWCNRI